MFPNNYNMPFSMPYGNPTMSMGMRMNPRIGLSPGLRNGFGTASRNGLFSRLVGGVRGINFQSILNNTSHALGVINQAIPIVKQVGPIYNNMKSMLKIASLFKDETDPPRKSNSSNTNNNNNSNNNTNIESNEEKENTIITNNYSNSPNFFI